MVTPLNVIRTAISVTPGKFVNAITVSLKNIFTVSPSFTFINLFFCEISDKIQYAKLPDLSLPYKYILPYISESSIYMLKVAGGEFKNNCKDEILLFIVPIFVLIESTFNFKSFNEYAPGK